MCKATSPMVCWASQEIVKKQRRRETEEKENLKGTDEEVAYEKRKEDF